MGQAMVRQSNPRSDPDLWAVVVDRGRPLDTGTEKLAVQNRIRELVRRGLQQGTGVPRLKHVASEAGVSERTLIRALQRQQTSFHAIVDDERKKAAMLMIWDHQATLPDIAGALGFSSQSSFGRTFKSWTGISPGEYRKRRKSNS